MSARRPIRPIIAATLVFGWIAASSEARAADPPGGPPVLPPASDPINLDLGLRIGGAARIGGSSGYGLVQRGGFTIGAGVAIAPSQRFAVGLGYEHTGLGSEHGEGDLGSVDISRALDALWLSLRLSLFRTQRFALVASIAPGLLFQSESADVIANTGPGSPPVAFACSESGAFGFGLRAGLGAEVLVGNDVWFTADAALDNLRLSSEPLGTCVQGAGSVTMIGVRAGFAYRFDVSRGLR